VTDDNGPWIRYLLGAAAVTQLAEAQMLAPTLAGATGARTAVSEHPESGPRAEPDRMTFAAGVFVNAGDGPCEWSPGEFRDAVTEFMNQPPASDACVEGDGVAIEFPFGGTTSLCRILGDQPHPLYGNGLLVLQRFPMEIAETSDGIRLAMSLNAADLTKQATGYGLGSYVYADGAVYFNGFIPNALYKPALLANVYASCAARAQSMAARFTEGTWDPDAVSLDVAVLARRADQRRAAATVVERPLRGCPMMARAKAGES
jgi:hypothetical protein